MQYQGKAPPCSRWQKNLRGSSSLYVSAEASINQEVMSRVVLKDFSVSETLFTLGSKDAERGNRVTRTAQVTVTCEEAANPVLLPYATSSSSPHLGPRSGFLRYASLVFPRIPLVLSCSCSLFLLKRPCSHRRSNI